MKRFYTISIFVIFFTHWHVSVSAQTTVNFPDSNLAAAVRTALGLAEGADIPRTSLQELTVLYAASAAITDLTGLEEASGLRTLTLSENQIRDITPLRDLTAGSFSFTYFLYMRERFSAVGASCARDSARKP